MKFTASRRTFLQSALLAAGSSLCVEKSGARAEFSAAASPEVSPSEMPVVLHQTDLFRPHADPDDHFDLALIFGLARAGRIDLAGVVLDFPNADFINGDPDVIAVAQMNRICKLSVPAVVGSRFKQKTPDDTLPDAPDRELAAVEFIIETLRRADRPVRFKCGSSAPDIAVAALREPDLFREKCGGVYVNCGSAYPNPEKPGEQEYNVTVNRAGQAAVFNDLPCPVYWFPCWQRTLDWKVGEYATYFEARHDQLLDGVSPAMRSYFYAMFTQTTDAQWMRNLERGVPDESWFKVINTQNNGMRAIWAAASLFLLAGQTVTREGEIVASADISPEDVLFRLENIHIRADEQGRFEWSFCEEESRRKIFHVLDPEHYTAAMVRALNTVYRTLGASSAAKSA